MNTKLKEAIARRCRSCLKRNTNVGRIIEAELEDSRRQMGRVVWAFSALS